LEVVTVLLAFGANLQAKKRVSLVSVSVSSCPQRKPPSDLQEDWTPLQFACDGGHEEVVSVLLAAGATIKTLDYQVLFFASLMRFTLTAYPFLVRKVAFPPCLPRRFCESCDHLAGMWASFTLYGEFELTQGGV
jgi:hypothetical protein